MITKFIVVLGAVSLAAGLLVMMLPGRAWAGLTPARSRWSNQASVAGALLFGGLALGGGGLLLLSVSDLLGGWRSARWEPVEATVVESRLAEVRQIRSTNPAFRPAVLYRYQAAGRMHTGERLAFGAMATPDRAAVETDLATRFAAGSPLTVRVDPANPAEAVLEAGVQPKAGILGALGAVLLTVGLWQVVALARDWEGNQLVPAERRRNRRKQT